MGILCAPSARITAKVTSKIFGVMDAECRRALSGSGAWTSSEDLFAGCLRQSKCACCGVDLAAQPPGVGGGPDEAGDVAGSGGCDLTAWTSTDMAHEPGASSIVPM